MSLNVTARSLSESSFFPVIDTASAASAQGRAPADAFFARATLKALDLGDTGVRNAAFAPSASVESLFGAQTLTPSLTVPPVDLEVGASGPDVLNMQNCLVALGYLSQDLMNTNPGFFGQNTLAALNAFQAEHGLQPANRFGSGSRTAMNAAVSRLPTIDNIIDTAYRSLLGRAPDTGGQLSWRRGLEQQAQAGASPEQLRASIEAGIKASPEYQNRNVTPQQMVNDLYAQVLERPADTGGAQHFLQRYNELAGQGMSRADIRNTLQAEMQASPEYGVKEMVKGLYQQLLNRGLDPAGRKGWVDYGLNQLAQGADINAVRSDIANQIMQSPEYQAIHKDDVVPGADAAIEYALHPGPNPFRDDGNWYYYCLGLVNVSYQHAGRTIPELQLNCALDSYNAYKNEGKIHTDGIPPKGAVVFYDSFGSDGHIGISLGDGRIVNTFESGPQTGTRGLYDVPNYLGWAIP